MFPAWKDQLVQSLWALSLLNREPWGLEGDLACPLPSLPSPAAACVPLSLQVAETCQLAVRRLEWLQQQSGESVVRGPYLSVDPAPPAEERDLGQLREALLDETRPLFDRYRAMFALRDAGGKEAALALAEGEEGLRGWGSGSGPLGPRGHVCCTELHSILDRCILGQILLCSYSPWWEPRPREAEGLVQGHTAVSAAEFGFDPRGPHYCCWWHFLLSSAESPVQV